jgi:aspartyl-tRNA(Asn)/glutamyl-tRNA(Gln) amidotransferase subunit C
MSKLTKSEVLHVAKLAKIDLTDAEIEKYSPQLSKVIEFVGNLKEVDVKGVMPTAQVTGLENVLRSDEVNPANSLSQDDALSGTDKIHNGYFKVDAILSERSDK